VKQSVAFQQLNASALLPHHLGKEQAIGVKNFFSAAKQQNRRQVFQIAENGRNIRIGN